MDEILLESTEWNSSRGCKGWGWNSEVEVLTKFLKCKSREIVKERISSNKLEKEKGILTYWRERDSNKLEKGWDFDTIEKVKKIDKLERERFLFVREIGRQFT